MSTCIFYSPVMIFNTVFLYTGYQNFRCPMPNLSIPCFRKMVGNASPNSKKAKWGVYHWGNVSRNDVLEDLFFSARSNAAAPIQTSNVPSRNVVVWYLSPRSRSLGIWCMISVVVYANIKKILDVTNCCQIPDILWALSL